MLDTRIQLSKLEVYCRVIELESVTKAAKELFISQPVVTTHVRSLQERLGAKLLYRQGHSMKPTEAGQHAYEWAKDILTRSEEMARRIEGLADGSQGSVAAVASMTVGSYILPPILTRFQRQRPLARIGLDIFDPEHVLSGVESGQYDFGVLITDNRLTPHSLVFEKVGEEEFILVASPAADIPDVIDPASLAEMKLISSPNARVREHLLTDLLMTVGVERGPTTLELGHAEAMKRSVKEGDSLSFLFASSVEDELRRGGLRQIKLRGVNGLRTPIYLVHREGAKLSPMQNALIEAIKEELPSPS